MLQKCQNAADAKMMEICGDTMECTTFATDKTMGTESLASYTNKNGDIEITGLISFGNIKIAEATSTPENIKFGPYEINISDYQSHLSDTDPNTQRIVSALGTVASKINQKIAILSNDPTIQMCVEGRDLSQATGGTRTRRYRSSNDPNGENKDPDEKFTEGRFPHLLDSYILAIVNSGIDQARQNYSTKYDSMLTAATEQQNDTIKAVLCAAMATSDAPQCTEYGTDSDGNPICQKYEPTSNKFGTVFNDQAAGMTTDAQNMYATKYTITNAKMSELAKVQQSGHSEHPQVDDHGNMIGKMSMSAVYSPSNNTCTLTTVTTMCKNMEKLITTDKITDKCGAGGISILGKSGNGACQNKGILSIGGASKTKTIETQTFHGVACKDFADPVTDVQSIQL
ncbi:hypothetical protein HDR66_01480 [bacterium]|nr:hypothetical protein [bacterium]